MYSTRFESRSELQNRQQQQTKTIINNVFVFAPKFQVQL